MLKQLFSRGLPGAISRDLLKKYLLFKKKYLEENEESILNRIKKFWLTLNKQKILTKDSEDKQIRLQIIEDSWFNKNDRESSSLYNIEADITPLDKKVYNHFKLNILFSL